MKEGLRGFGVDSAEGFRGLGVRMLWGSVGGLLGEAPEAEPGAGLATSLWKPVAGIRAWVLLSTMRWEDMCDMSSCSFTEQYTTAVLKLELVCQRHDSDRKHGACLHGW